MRLDSAIGITRSSIPQEPRAHRKKTTNAPICFRELTLPRVFCAVRQMRCERRPECGDGSAASEPVGTPAAASFACCHGRGAAKRVRGASPDLDPRPLPMGFGSATSSPSSALAGKATSKANTAKRFSSQAHVRAVGRRGITHCTGRPREGFDDASAAPNRSLTKTPARLPGSQFRIAVFVEVDVTYRE